MKHIGYYGYVGMADINQFNAIYTGLYTYLRASTHVCIMI